MSIDKFTPVFVTNVTSDAIDGRQMDDYADKAIQEDLTEGEDKTSSAVGESHLTVGTALETLCGAGEVFIAVQREQPTEFLRTGTDSSHCADCLTAYEQSDITPEPTIDCHRCGIEYSARLARLLEHEAVGTVEVCKPCYRTVATDDDTDVTVAHEAATPVLADNGDRQFDQGEKL